MGNSHQHRPQLQQDHDMTTSSILGPDVTMDLGVSMCLSDQLGLSCSLVPEANMVPGRRRDLSGHMAPVATGAKDFTTDHGCNKAVDPDMATAQSRRPSQPQVAAQATWISMAPRAQTWSGNPEAKYPVAFVGTWALDINIDPSDDRTQTQSSAASQRISPWPWLTAQASQISITKAAR